MNHDLPLDHVVACSHQCEVIPSASLLATWQNRWQAFVNIRTDRQAGLPFHCTAVQISHLLPKQTLFLVRKELGIKMHEHITLQGNSIQGFKCFSFLIFWPIMPCLFEESPMSIPTHTYRHASSISENYLFSPPKDNQKIWCKKKHALSHPWVSNAQDAPHQTCKCNSSLPSIGGVAWEQTVPQRAKS